MNPGNNSNGDPSGENNLSSCSTTCNESQAAALVERFYREIVDVKILCCPVEDYSDVNLNHMNI